MIKQSNLYLCHICQQVQTNTHSGIGHYYFWGGIATHYMCCIMQNFEMQISNIVYIILFQVI